MEWGGLSQGEAIRRLQEEGWNELPLSKPKNLRNYLIELIREPMASLLVGCGIVYLILGDPQEALVLLGFLLLMMVITAVQAHKAGRALDALRDLSSPRALVIREGIRKRIPGREVARGDWVVVQEGDRVPADGQLIQGEALGVDESLLTGESNSVVKSSGAQVLRDSQLFASTTVVHGQGIMEVAATGLRTEIGKIGKWIQSPAREQTHLERQMLRWVKILAWLSAILCGVLVLVYGLTRGNWLGGLLAGLTLAMAILPNELPAVLTIFLALGAWRIAKRRVLTRKMSAIENLGAATVLCVDKTGTLTQNRMVVQRLYADHSVFELKNSGLNSLPEQFHEVLEFGILASRPDPFDPMEQAFQSAGAQFLRGTEHLHSDWTVQKEYPLTTELMSISYVWKSKRSGEWVVGAKGAPEAVMDLCHLESAQISALSSVVQEFAGQGLRVLGVAKACLNQSELPTKQHDFDFEWVGLVGLADPVRPEVPAAITECQLAGVRVIMMTGDHPKTAQWIGRQIGLQSGSKVLTGQELALLTEVELREVVKTHTIFSRVFPEQKLKLVEALKKNGEIVAMTGDGVNDAPALRGAQIGIAMGRRGTDVAREAATLVLLDDDFASIVDAIRMGRRIYSNIQGAFAYLIAIHIPIAGMSVLPVFLNLPLVLLPIHIAFLHLIIEPVCSIAFEAELPQSNLMRQLPRSPDSPLLTLGAVFPAVLQGVSILISLAAIYGLALYRGQGEADARTLSFTSLVVSNLVLIMTSRAVTLRIGVKNPWTVGIVAGSLVLLLAVLYQPNLRGAFRFSVLHPLDWVICLGVGGVSVVWFGVLQRMVKIFEHRRVGQFTKIKD